MECNKEVIEEISSNFKFNDAVIRNMILQRKSAITEKSSILTDEEDESNNSSEIKDNMRVIDNETIDENGVENV